MAIPLQLTSEELVTEALKRAGRPSPRAGDITSALQHQLLEVMADIRLIAPTHRFFKKTLTFLTVPGNPIYALDLGADSLESAFVAIGNDDYQGVVTAATTNTFSAAFAAPLGLEGLRGRPVFVAGQKRFITGFDGTRVTVHEDWDPVPTVGQSWVIGQTIYNLDVEHVTAGRKGQGVPCWIDHEVSSVVLAPTPDKIYAVEVSYFLSLDRFNDQDPVFKRILQQWRSLLMQGVTAKSMQRFDDDRYVAETQIYDAMLTPLATKSCRVLPLTGNERL